MTQVLEQEPTKPVSFAEKKKLANQVYNDAMSQTRVAAESACTLSSTLDEIIDAGVENFNHILKRFKSGVGKS